MSNIIGIPTTRVADLFVHQRVLDQLQYDLRELFRLQTQLSTGRQFQLPGEEPMAALRVMSLQRLLERKEQVRNNLTTTQSYLSAADAAMSSVSGLVTEVRGLAVAMMNQATVGEQQRRAAIEQVQAAIEQLIDTGNESFRGRFLFAGSATATAPFQMGANEAVQYLGNEGQVLSYCDVDMLFASNIDGSRIFGAISEPVRGTADLNPILTENTRLADLRGGEGIRPGSIAISDGTHTRVVDLSTAETIGDVAALIHANPPGSRSLDVEVTATGLVIQLDDAPGNLAIREVGSGRTAAELGILCPDGVGNDPLVGEDLDPILRTTTRLDDILGTRARAVVRLPGTDNDFMVEADAPGPDLNGVTITLVHDPAVAAGEEVVTYDAVLKAIEIRIDQGMTQAHHVTSAINQAHALGVLPFTARLDPLDNQNGGWGLVPATAPGETAGVTAGGSGTAFDRQSGLQILSAGRSYTIDLSSAETIEDVLNLLNQSGAGVLAEINRAARGIDVRSRLSGADFAIGENGGTTAAQLGLRTFTTATRLEDLNFGRGVEMSDGVDFTIQLTDGTTIEVDLDSQQTIGDVLDLLNTLAGGALEARLNRYGNGIELVDHSGGAGTLTVTSDEHSTAAVDLGLVPSGQQSASAPAAQPDVLSGADVHPLETEGLFTALVRLKQGLEANDLWTIQRAVAMLDERVLEMNFGRAELGVRQQSLDVLQSRLDSEDVELRQALSLELDADLTEVASNLAARQAALAASLMATARILQMSLLDYL